MSFAGLEIVKIMRWSNFDRTRAKFPINQDGVSHNGNCASG